MSLGFVPPVCSEEFVRAVSLGAPSETVAVFDSGFVPRGFDPVVLSKATSFHARHFHAARAAVARPLLESQLHAHLLPGVLGAGFGAVRQMHRVRFTRGRRGGRRHGLAEARVRLETPRVIGQRAGGRVVARTRHGCRATVTGLAHRSHGTQGEIRAAVVAGGPQRDRGSQILRRRRGRSATLGSTPLESVLFKPDARHDRHAFILGKQGLGQRQGVRGRGVGVEERNEDRFLHQFVDKLDGGVENLGGRRHGRIGAAKDIIPDVAGHVNFPWGSRNDIRRQKPLPKHAEMLTFGPIGSDRQLVHLVAEGEIGVTVALGFQGEFQGFQAVVLREIGHEGAESVRRGCRVGQHLVEGWPHGTKHARRNGQTQRTRASGLHVLVRLAIRRRRRGGKFRRRTGSVVPEE